MQCRIIILKRGQTLNDDKIEITFFKNDSDTKQTFESKKNFAHIQRNLL